MSFPIVLKKQLAAAVSNGIATSQSVSANVPFVLNGSLTNRLSTTTTAAVAAGGVVIPLSSVTGVVVGQVITDTSATALPTGTTVVAVGTSGVTIWPPVGGATVGNGDTIVFPGTATLDTATAANVAIGRRVVVAYTGSDCNFTVVGTNASGAVITDTFTGVSGAGTSNLDFVTVTSITPSGSITTATAGTNGVGASPWVAVNSATTPFNIECAIIIGSGLTVNCGIQYTYDDPNNLPAGVSFPAPFNHPTLNNVTTSADGSINDPVAAIRLIINSGTDPTRGVVMQAGIG